MSDIGFFLGGICVTIAISILLVYFTSTRAYRRNRNNFCESIVKRYDALISLSSNLTKTKPSISLFIFQYRELYPLIPDLVKSSSYLLKPDEMNMELESAQKLNLTNKSFFTKSYFHSMNADGLTLNIGISNEHSITSSTLNDDMDRINTMRQNIEIRKFFWANQIRNFGW